MRWAAELVAPWSLKPAPGFRLFLWRHDDCCPLHPDHGALPDPSSRCQCEPDGVLGLDIGTREERWVEIIRNGIPLSIHMPPHRREPS
jgi:hypothetical protein